MISRFILKIFGWKLVGQYPADPKFVVAVAPHTSNWDFPLGILVRAAMVRDVKFIGKDSLFKGPLGLIMRFMNGIPVDRSKNNNFVDAVVDMYNSREEFAICIAPEGTRKKVDKLKSGFYHIAVGAKVPICFCKFDWGNYVVSFSEPFYPTGNAEADMEHIVNYFKGTIGHTPENGIM